MAIVLTCRVALLLTPLALAAGQSQTGGLAARPKFEVASVKSSKRSTTEPAVRVTPGRLSVENMTLRRLIFVAYRVRDFQISNGPAWIDSERFEIDAKTDGQQGVDAMLLMLQDLLEDRFHLRSHRETRDGPVYLLTTTTNGNKMHPSTCVPFDPNNLPKQSKLSDQERARQCGGIRSSSAELAGNGMSIEDGTGPPFQSLAGQLSLILDRPVLNKTGLSGLFDVQLHWNGNPTDLPNARPGDPPPATDDSAPSIFTAVEEQLGLKLAAGKGPVEYFVIDSAQKPEEN